MTSIFKHLTLVALLGATPVMAQTPLNQEAHINEVLQAGFAADIIRNECSSISAKMFVVLGELSDLEDYARDKGYAEADVKAFLKDKTEKARLKASAKAYLAKAGVVVGDEESYCKAGRAEIEKGSLIGSLLRSWK